MPASHLDKFPVLHKQILPAFDPEAAAFAAQPPLGSRRIKAIVVGAGLSGIIAGALLPAKVKNLDLVIYERNSGFGGVWFSHTYPGVRCDVPSHIYQSSFDPNTQWKYEYSPGSDIQKYWTGVAVKHGVDKLVHFSHEIVEARWDNENGVWHVRIKDLKTGNISQDQANILINVTGRFSSPRLPDIPGIENFKGQIVHPSNWDKRFSAKGKRIAVIGNGATGVQIVPELQKEAARLDHYVRKPTWITKSLYGNALDEPQGYQYSEQEKALLREPDKYLEFRKALESNTHKRFDGVLYGSPGTKSLIESSIELIYDGVNGNEELFKKLIPTYIPGCRRLTPTPGYVKALTQPNAEYIVTPIKKFTANSIITEDGIERPIDALVCATGYSFGLAPAFPIIGKHGAQLKTLLSGKNAPLGHSVGYFGVGYPGFPNFFCTLGLNSNALGGSVPLQNERLITYIAKVLRKIQLEDIKSITPSLQASIEFTDKVNQFGRLSNITKGYETYFVEKDANGQLRGVLNWPGTARHALEARANPRWEDYEYEYRDPSNRYNYFGNGRSQYEIEQGDLTHYVNAPGSANLATLHEEEFKSKL